MFLSVFTFKILRNSYYDENSGFVKGAGEKEKKEKFIQAKEEEFFSFSSFSEALFIIEIV